MKFAELPAYPTTGTDLAGVFRQILLNNLKLEKNWPRCRNLLEAFNPVSRGYFYHDAIGRSFNLDCIAGSGIIPRLRTSELLL